MDSEDSPESDLGACGYFLCCVFLSRILFEVYMILTAEFDTEGLVSPDNDPPQQMGDPSIEVCIKRVINSF